MTLYDADGTTTGSASVSGSAAVLMALTEGLSGGSSLDGPGVSDAVVDETLEGNSTVSADGETLINVSGYVVGSGSLIDARLMDATATTFGMSSATANATRILSASGYSIGVGNFYVSVPEPIIGAAIVTAFMEVICVPPPVCSQPTATLQFRWGHQFTAGDLVFHTSNNRGPFGPVCITYTLYQMQNGCQSLKQIGPSGRKPGTSGVGCYYVTGTAGECGQPGLWAVRWRYQRTFADPVVEKDCYFRVVDSVSDPIRGDNLKRYCKYGWD